MNEKDVKILIWVLVTLTFLVSAFAIFIIWNIINFVPSEEIAINISQALE